MVTQSYFPFQERGGPVVKVRALAHGLAHRGHQVTVLTADLGITRFEGTSVHVERYKDGWRATEDGVETIYLSTLLHYRDVTLNPGMVRFCRASLSSYQLVHFYGLYDIFGPVVSRFCRQRRIPYAIEPMGMYRPIDRGFRLKRLWHRNLGVSYWNHSSLIVATSEMEQQELLADGVPAEKLVIRYNGIDRDAPANQPPRGSFRSQFGISSGDPLIVFLSRLIPRKGADILIDAFARVCPASGYLVIAGPEGEPGYLDILKKRAESAGVASRVIFTGPLYDAAKNALLADADVFALPSRYENFANVAAEAMSFGVPVVITESCGIRSLVDGRAGLVIQPEVAPLAAALQNLISDPVLHKNFQAGCRQVTEELRWDFLAGKMDGYYSQILARAQAADGNHAGN